MNNETPRLVCTNIECHKFAPESEWCIKCDKCSSCCGCAVKFVQNLMDAIAESIFEEDPDVIREELERMGYDVDKLEADGLALIEKLRKEANDE